MKTKSQDIIRAIFGGLVIIGFFAFLGLFLYNPPTEDNAATLLTSMVSILGTLVGSIGFYYFGSSSGSKEKQDILDRVVNHKDAS